MANNIKLDIAVQTARDLNLTSSAVNLEGKRTSTLSAAPQIR